MTRDQLLPAKPQRVTLSQQAQLYLRGLIDAGTYAPGDQLPPQAQLAEQLGISRLTLREALLALEQEGLVVLRHGIGTFVAPGGARQLQSGLERLESVMQLAARQGLRAHCRGLVVSPEPAGEAEAAALEVAPGTLLTAVRRAIAVDGEPVAYMEDYAPAWLLAPDGLGECFEGSVLDLLRTGAGSGSAQAIAGITAVNAGPELGGLLGVPSDRPLLVLEETLFGADGTPLDFSRNYFVPEFFRFHVVRR